jgi:hypothetical protein
MPRRPWTDGGDTASRRTVIATRHAIAGRRPAGPWLPAGSGRQPLRRPKWRCNWSRQMAS